MVIYLWSFFLYISIIFISLYNIYIDKLTFNQLLLIYIYIYIYIYKLSEWIRPHKIFTSLNSFSVKNMRMGVYTNKVIKLKKLEDISISDLI